MQNQIYDEYIRSILGYAPINNQIMQDFDYIEDVSNIEEMQMISIMQYDELEKCYPEIYKIIYPMIKTKCNNMTENITKEDIENMTNEIYYAMETKDDTLNSRNVTNTTNITSEKKEVRELNNNNDKREDRQIKNIRT